MGRATTLLAMLCALLLAPTLKGLAATMTASLDRDQVIAGESATLTLTFEGGRPDAFPSLGTIPNLQISNQGTGQNMRFDNGQFSSTITQSYSVTPLRPGVYHIPALRTTIGGQPVASQPLTLTAVKPEEPAQGQTADQQLSFMRLVVPKKDVFVGQAVPVELQVFVRDGVLNQEEILRAFDGYNSAPITAEGCRILRTAHTNRRRAQSGSSAYGVSTLVTAITPAREGSLTIQSIKVPLTLQLPLPGQRRRDVFDPFGMFQQTRRQDIVLVAPQETLTVSPLPSANVPTNFNGAVGSFKLNLDAGPTNVAVGDPITVHIRIEGSGNLEGLALPDQPAWGGFKSYPPTSKIETTDPLGLQGVKTFEQVLVPQSDQIKELPPLAFSFFDPEKRAYLTLSSPALPLIVRPGGSSPPPAVVTSRTSSGEEPPPAPDIVPIKRRLGSIAGPSRPLIQRPSFLALQLLPVAALVGAIFWRRRQEAWDANPRLRRRHNVRRKVHSGLVELRTAAANNKSDEFFLAVFRLLQEQIGERLDLPASSITESVVDEHLRPKGVPEDLLGEVRSLFLACDQARYAPVRSSEQLEAIIPRVEAVIQKLEGLDL